MSPVIRTKASTPPHSNLSAVTGPRVKTSRLFGDGGEISHSALPAGTASCGSNDGLGGGGRMKESAES